MDKNNPIYDLKVLGVGQTRALGSGLLYSWKYHVEKKVSISVVLLMKLSLFFPIYYIKHSTEL